MGLSGAADQQVDIAGLCEAMAHFSPTPLVAVEGAGHSIVYVNPAFTKLIGLRREEMVGKAFSSTVSSGDECLLMLDHIYRTGEPAVYTRAEHSAPNPFFWSYVMWPLRTKARTVGIIVQITETSESHQQATAFNEAFLLSSLRQHELKEAAETLNLQLQTEIVERRNAQEALIQSAKLATVGVMAASLAHELNNPLESLTNLIYLASKDKTLCESTANYLAGAEEELERVAYMAKQTLGLYRESSKLMPVSISELLTNLLSIFSSKIRNKQIEVVFEVDGEEKILAVAGELRQVFANLIGNSIDALGIGGTIRIRVSAVASKGVPGVRITFADNGTGITKADLEKIFTPFFTTKITLGTGLGLWISKRIVERCEGSIRIRSLTDPGRSGTAASVFLPKKHIEQLS